jgi:hypothetical protein
MKFIITENKMNVVMKKFLNDEFEGFSDIYYTWANFNCGMGECCDMYAVGFVLPKTNYDDYLFILVDSENYRPFGEYKDYPEDLPEPCYEQPDINDPKFDTILISEGMYEEMENYFSFFDDWENELLRVLNRTFHMNVKNIRLEYEM